MDDLCTAKQAVNREHRKEYFETRMGEIWDKCANCGSVFFDRYVDCGSGG